MNIEKRSNSSIFQRYDYFHCSNKSLVRLTTNVQEHPWSMHRFHRRYKKKKMKRKKNTSSSHTEWERSVLKVRAWIYLLVAAKHIGKYICSHISLTGAGKMNVCMDRKKAKHRNREWNEIMNKQVIRTVQQFGRRSTM